MEEKVIEAVRRRTILYDTSHRDYMRSKLKTDLWEEVAKEADLKSGAAAKSVWEKLRHSFRDALRRQKQTKRSGAPAEAIKLWKFQKEMGFLQRFMTNRVRDGNLQDDSDSDDTQSSNFASKDCASNKEQPIPNVMSDNENEYESDTQSSNISAAIPNSTDGDVASVATQSSQANPKPYFPHERKNFHSTKSTKMKNNVAALITSNMKIRQQMSAQRSEERKQLLREIKTPSDPLHHFFMSMYESTKRMPPASQLTVRNQVYEVVSKMEATLLNVPGPIHSSQQIWNPSYSNTPSPCSSLDHNPTTREEYPYPDNTLANIITAFSQNTK